MGIKVTIPPLTQEDNSSFSVKLNEALQKLSAEFDKVQYRDGSLDAQGNWNLNSRRLMNLPLPVHPTEPLRLDDLSRLPGFLKGDKGDTGAPGEVTFSSLSGDTGSTLVGYKVAGLNTLGRKISDFLEDSINAKDFAKGDNATNDTAGLQSAIDKGIATGKVVRIPYGDYRCTTLNINGRVTLYFDKGARLIKTSGTGYTINIEGLTSRIYGVSILGRPSFSNLTDATAGAAIRVKNAGQITLDTRCDSFPAKNFKGIELENVSQVVVSAEVQNSVSSGVVFRDCLDITIMPGFRSDANGGWGVEVDTCSGVYGFGSAYGNGLGGVKIVATVTTPVLADAPAFHFWNHFISDTNGGHNWHVEKLSRSVFTSCWGATNTGADHNKQGFYVKDSFAVEFAHCIAEGNYDCGLFVEGASSVSITGGRYNGNTRHVDAVRRAGICAGAGGVSLLINGAKCQDVGYATKTQTYGFRATHSLTSLQIADCDLSENAGAPYLISATPAFFSESGNYVPENTTLPSLPFLVLPWFGDNFTVSGTNNIGTLGNMYKGRTVHLTFTDSLTIGPGFGLRMAGPFNATQYDTITFTTADGANITEVCRSANA